MYVRDLTLENFRSFEHARIELNVPGRELGEGRFPNVTLLLGDNGAGKTSVLRAIALAALSPVITSGSGYVPYSLVRRVSGREPAVARVQATLELHEQDSLFSPGSGPGRELSPDGGGLIARDAGRSYNHDPKPHLKKVGVEIEPTRGFVDRFRTNGVPDWAEPMWDEHSPAFLVVGYGAARRVDSPNANLESIRQKTRALRYDRVAGLFEEAVTLVPLSSWLPHLLRADRTRHFEVVDLINKLLVPHASVLPEAEKGEHLFLINGSELPFAALSDGYRAYIGWIADLLYHICMGAPPRTRLTEQLGIVLIDEIDLHLHPEWQRTVIPTIARTLPNLQFVLTSHSPLVVGSLWQENVFVLDSTEHERISHTTIEPSPREVFGLSADQILTSGHFGLHSTRNEQTVARLAEQAKSAQAGDPEAAISLLRIMALGGAESDEPRPVAPATKKAAKKTKKKTAKGSK